MKAFGLVVTACFALLGCDSGGDDDDAPDAGAATADAAGAMADAPPFSSPDASGGGDPLIEARPYGMVVPSTYDPSTPMPFVLLLHGYTLDGAAQMAYFGMEAAAERHGFLLAYPNGTVNSQGKRFWNATNACCDTEGSGVDDVAYLTAVLDDVAAKYNVDPRRVYLIGHSNGGYMSHRMACERGERIAGIISLAGMTWKDPALCPAAVPVNVLQVHGEDDLIVLFGGNGIYPSAPETVAIWADKNGCSGGLVAGPRKDLDTLLGGEETSTQSTSGCPAGGAVDFWTIENGHHLPVFDPGDWSDEVWAWFEAHPRP